MSTACLQINPTAREDKRRLQRQQNDSLFTMTYPHCSGLHPDIAPCDARWLLGYHHSSFTDTKALSNLGKTDWPFLGDIVENIMDESCWLDGPGGLSSPYKRIVAVYAILRKGSERTWNLFYKDHSLCLLGRMQPCSLSHLSEHHLCRRRTAPLWAWYEEAVVSALKFVF